MQEKASLSRSGRYAPGTTAYSLSGKVTITAHENWLKNFAVALSTVGKKRQKK